MDRGNSLQCEEKGRRSWEKGIVKRGWVRGVEEVAGTPGTEEINKGSASHHRGGG